MIVQIIESAKENLKAVIKIEKLFQRILKAMMHREYFEEIYEQLKDFADRAERISEGKLTESPKTREKGFGESLKLTPSWRN